MELPSSGCTHDIVGSQLGHDPTADKMSQTRSIGALISAVAS